MKNNINEHLIDIFYSGLEVVEPYNCVNLHLNRIRDRYQEGHFKKMLLISFGKAAYPMSKAVVDNMGDLLDSGILITKYGHTNRSDEISSNSWNKIEIFEAGHPIPDENGLIATQRVIELLKGAGEDCMVLSLISGGGSALLVSPYEPLKLDDKQKLTELLLKSGADIHELNTVRKHISKVKGGRLAEITYPANILSLILSDVIGDKLDVIASGPTTYDETTYGDAIDILNKYNLMDKLPETVIKILKSGKAGLIPETPKKGDQIFKNVENIIIGSSNTLIENSKRRSEILGFSTKVVTTRLTGEARDAGKWLGRIVKEEISKKSKNLVLISGGETTVRVNGNGVGGRNMELALSFAMEIEGLKGVSLLSAGTDGTDGPTDAAGAIVNGETIKIAREKGINPEEHLNNNDSYNFFKKTGELFITGPTGTNVMDIQIIMIL